MIVASLIVLTEPVSSQCVEHPDGKTAVILKNDTKHDVVFRIDDNDKGTVPSKRSSREWEVTPGEHLLVAGAIIDRRMYWVWTENELPKGQVCTWTLFDPEMGGGGKWQTDFGEPTIREVSAGAAKTICSSNYDRIYRKGEICPSLVREDSVPGIDLGLPASISSRYA
jgi:hypothetical protein